MKLEDIHRSTLSLILPLGLVFFLFSQFFISDTPTNLTHFEKDENSENYKQKGAHVFGRFDSLNLLPVVENNIEWVTLVPYGNMKTYDSPEVVYSWGDTLFLKRRDSIWGRQINLAHEHGLEVFFKPHIWIRHTTGNKWRSDVFPADEEGWETWQESYRNFIMVYATIAEKYDVEMFCIGAELSRLSTEKHEFWIDLIRDVRKVYSGKITYAANWYKEYEKIKFWDQLDYIGVQAYFPLVKNEYPSVKQISKGWNKYIPKLEEVHKKYNRKIIFTEMGYKSTADSAIKPWHWIESISKEERTFSIETQTNCYQAFFNTVWKKDWFAGVHIWQMRSDYVPREGENDLDFTPQGKPASNVIAKGFE